MRDMYPATAGHATPPTRKAKDINCLALTKTKFWVYPLEDTQDAINCADLLWVILTRKSTTKPSLPKVTESWGTAVGRWSESVC